MGERFPGHLTIGGKLPRSLIPKFCEMANDEGAGLDWANFEDTPVTPEHVKDAAKTDAQLTLMSCEAPWGHFEYFEEWLKKIGMSYELHSDSYCEYEAHTELWVDGKTTEVMSNNSGDAMIYRHDAEAALAALREGRVYDAMTTLNKVAFDLPKVPPFEIIDDLPPKKKRTRKK